MTGIRFLQPSFPPVDQIAADYAAILDRGIFSNSGPCDGELVDRVEAFVGNGVHAATVSSCTAGLELAARATFRDRPRALIASFTFAAAALALVSAGFTPEFLDVDADSWQPDINDARRVLAESHADIAGILLTSTFGVANDSIAEWESLAEEYAVPVVIDSAAGFGAEYQSGERLGARGTCEVFSMHATKMLAAGEGGLVTSRDASLIARLNQTKNFGFDADRVTRIWGTNAKLPELAAAIALRQLDVLPTRLALRRHVIDAYSAELTPLGVLLQPNAERSAPAFASILLPSGAARETAVHALTAAGIETRTYYSPPVHRSAYFASAASTELKVTDDMCSRILSLPMADTLDARDIARICTLIAEACGG